MILISVSVIFSFLQGGLIADNLFPLTTYSVFFAVIFFLQIRGRTRFQEGFSHVGAQDSRNIAISSIILVSLNLLTFLFMFTSAI